MSASANVIETAQFNPRIRGYILFVGAFVMFICVVTIPLMVLWLLGIGQYISKRVYDNLECRLTDRHLEFKKGALFRVEKTIPLENIQDLTFIDNPFLRLFDLRVLKIETAGSSNPHGSDMKLTGIIDAAGFKQRVLAQRSLMQAEDQASSVQHVTGSDENTELLREIRNLLTEIRDKN